MWYSYIYELQGSGKDKNQSRAEEMRDLFQTDMSERKQKRSIGSTGKKKSFKSKSRYELAYTYFRF